jgi:hypothetical protein
VLVAVVDECADRSGELLDGGEGAAPHGWRMMTERSSRPGLTRSSWSG